MTVEFSPGSCAFLPCAAHDQNVHSFVLLCFNVDGEDNGATVRRFELCRIHTSNKTPRMYSHIVVLCCVRSVLIVVLVLEQATHHGARAWFGVPCARRYMSMGQ